MYLCKTQKNMITVFAATIAYSFLLIMIFNKDKWWDLVRKPVANIPSTPFILLFLHIIQLNLYDYAWIWNIFRRKLLLLTLLELKFTEFVFKSHFLQRQICRFHCTLSYENQIVRHTHFRFSTTNKYKLYTPVHATLIFKKT